MLQIVGALILLIAGFAILRLLFRALISTASALAGLILLCLFGPALLAGYITERITRLFHIRWLAGVFLTIADSLTERIWLTLISQRISRGELREFELADGNWLLNNAWYERNMAGFNEQLKENLSFTPDELKTLFRNRLNLSPEANDDFLDRCLDGGDWYPFSEGRRFVSFHHVDELRICASCGLTEVHHAPENHKPDPEWYCSSLCRETETLCQEIYERPYNSFISDATANGLILMKLPET